MEIADIDKDGKVSFKEFLAAIKNDFQKHMLDAFKNIDTNGDGSISITELK